MLPVFKYSETIHSQNLLSRGNIRVGTLHDFRKAEHKKGIADANEGKKQVSFNIPSANTDTLSEKQKKSFEQFGGFVMGKGVRANLTNFNQIKSFNHQDCFIHCTSERYSANTLAQFDKADSCVEISDLEAFYEVLTRALNAITPVELMCVSRVHYKGRAEEWNGEDWGTHPALIKEPEFQEQYEVRAIWRPKGDDVLSHIILDEPGLIQFCRMRDLPI
ncbi:MULTISPECIES: hypothetical protein [unclassified Pseudomonas]|uniref:hypothetical protein n=1 Tax=unclassified Pseudomonas TaxID=196821 RepID=UPI0028929E6B|nr:MULTISPECIES: hypothetical protein [unclassified Pseudomonas]